MSKMEHAPSVTLEPHNEDDLWKTIKGFRDAGFLNEIPVISGK